MSSIILSDQALANLARIQAKDILRRIATRIDALQAFPRIGIVDTELPDISPDYESRITYVSPYGIRYRYRPRDDAIVIDAITDERIDSIARFLM